MSLKLWVAAYLKQLINVRLIHREPSPLLLGGEICSVPDGVL